MEILQRCDVCGIRFPFQSQCMLTPQMPRKVSDSIEHSSLMHLFQNVRTTDPREVCGWVGQCIKCHGFYCLTHSDYVPIKELVDTPFIRALLPPGTSEDALVACCPLDVGVPLGTHEGWTWLKKSETSGRMPNENRELEALEGALLLSCYKVEIIRGKEVIQVPLDDFDLGKILP